MQGHFQNLKMVSTFNGERLEGKKNYKLICQIIYLLFQDIVVAGNSEWQIMIINFVSMYINPWNENLNINNTVHFSISWGRVKMGQYNEVKYIITLQKI